MCLSLINFCYISFPSSETNLLKLFTPCSSLCIAVLMPTGLHHSALQLAGGYVWQRQTGSTFVELYPIETSPPSGKNSSAQSCVWTPGTCVPPVNTLQLTSMCVQTCNEQWGPKVWEHFPDCWSGLRRCMSWNNSFEQILCSEDFEVKPLKCVKRRLWRNHAKRC